MSHIVQKLSVKLGCLLGLLLFSSKITAGPENPPKPSPVVAPNPVFECGRKLAEKQIVMIDPDPVIMKRVTPYLTREGYTVQQFTDGGQGLRYVRATLPEVVVIEMAMKDGANLIREIRDNRLTQQIGIFVLSGRNEEDDVLLAYALGADQVMSKALGDNCPKLFYLQVAALRKWVSRDAPNFDEIVELFGLHLNVTKHYIRFHGSPIELTPTEFNYLRYFMKNPGRAFDRMQIMRSSGDYATVEARTIDVHIKTLRAKLRNAGVEQQVIETIRGRGYRFKEPD